MKSTPILFYTDGAWLKSGLGRIGRDLASLTATLPEFRVGFLGRGGVGSCQLPFSSYVFNDPGFGNDDLMDYVWRDFAEDGPGIIFAIYDPTRLTWLTHGEWFAKHQDRVQLWTYSPIDSHGPNERLSDIEAETLSRCHRVLAYGEFGAHVLGNTLGREIDWLPHGINGDVFLPRDRQAARIAAQFSPKDKVMGCVMTNQARKDWGVAAETLALLSQWKAWWHVDQLQRHWDLDAMIRQFGLQDRVRVTLSGSLNDTELSYFYSGCDVTILPSSEGWGFPLAESLACGTPVAHGAYGGGAWAEAALLIAPSLRLDGSPPRYRPVFVADEWATMLRGWGISDAAACRASVEHLFWKNLWPARWKKWMLEGVNGGR